MLMIIKMPRVGVWVSITKGPDFISWELGKAFPELMTFQLNTEIGVRRCPGKYEGNNHYKGAKVTNESLLVRQKWNTLSWIGWGLADTNTNGKWYTKNICLTYIPYGSP